MNNACSTLAPGGTALEIRSIQATWHTVKALFSNAVET
jgi:hypothetical protein